MGLQLDIVRELRLAEEEGEFIHCTDGSTVQEIPEGHSYCVLAILALRTGATHDELVEGHSPYSNAYQIVRKNYKDAPDPLLNHMVAMNDNKEHPTLGEIAQEVLKWRKKRDLYTSIFNDPYAAS